MTKIIAFITTLAIVAVIAYLLVVAPWVIGAVVICGGMMAIAWIFIMTLYTLILSLLGNLDLANHRRKTSRKNEEM